MVALLPQAPKSFRSRKVFYEWMVDIIHNLKIIFKSLFTKREKSIYNIFNYGNIFIFQKDTKLTKHIY